MIGIAAIITTPLLDTVSMRLPCIQLLAPKIVPNNTNKIPVTICTDAALKSRSRYP